MKLKSFLLFFLLGVSFKGMPLKAQVTFMGISINQSYLAFNQQLSQKATFDGETHQSASYYGNFAGIDGCYIIVESSNDKKVSKVSAIRRGLSKEVMNTVFSTYKQKYGDVYEQKIEYTKEGVPIYSYYFKCGITKIEVVIRYEEPSLPQSFFRVAYFPKGYINDKSNLRVNANDI